MLKLIFIGSINRSGGSLLARLFDGHSNIVSYPLEVSFPHDNHFYKITDNFAGIPMTVPVFEDTGKLQTKYQNVYPADISRSLTPDESIGEKEYDKYDLAGVPKSKPSISYKWGKEKSDIIGVRKNYLEKSFYDNVLTDFNFDGYVSDFKKFSNDKKKWAEIYNARHLAYFKNWDQGKLLTKNTTHVVTHDSGGLYLSNPDVFFESFEDSRFIIPIRNVLGYIASEKIRLARIFFGTRRFNKPHLPFFLIKNFDSYDLKAKIRNWSTAVTRCMLLQRKYNNNKRLIIYNNENLVNNTEKVMKKFAENMKFNYEKILSKPTIGNRSWGGNSHYGKSIGINKSIQESYKQILSKKEIELIEKKCFDLNDQIINQKNSFLNLTNIDEKYFKDLSYQKKYFHDQEKITLYYALVNSAGRKINIQKVNKYSVIALFFSIFARIYNLPRLIKQKYFPGKGKQNYT